MRTAGGAMKSLVERLRDEIEHPDTSGAPYVNDADLLAECLAAIEGRAVEAAAEPLFLHDLSDDAIRKRWRIEGGRFHGPNVETGTMPEALLLPWLRILLRKSNELETLRGELAERNERLLSTYETLTGQHRSTWPDAVASG